METTGSRGVGIGHGGSALGELAPPLATYETPPGKKRHVLFSANMITELPLLREKYGF